MWFIFEQDMQEFLVIRKIVFGFLRGIFSGVVYTLKITVIITRNVKKCILLITRKLLISSKLSSELQIF
jgi:hypothetical protein